MKKKWKMFVLLALTVVCLAFGLAGCNFLPKKDVDEDEAGRINPRIVIEEDELEFAMEIYSDYKVPYAGVYYENLDRVDGKEIRMSVIDPTGGYLYENTLDYETLRFVATGKYEIIYSAEGCTDAKITVYVCERLDWTGPVNFALSGNTLTWAAIDGASGYEVVVNGKNPTIVNEASFTSDIFGESGFYVGVTAKGDNKVWLDSYMQSYENKIALQDGELAAFNNPCYELDIGKATPDKLNAPPSEMEYVTEEDCKGSTDGAVKFVIRSGDYGTGLFRVYLDKTIDKEADFDGMEMRFKLDSKDYVYNADGYPTMLLLAQPNDDEQRPGRGMTLYKDYNDGWQILKWSKSAVSSFDGLNYLQFSLYMMTKAGGKGTLYLDYIRLYKDEIAAPQNVSVVDDKLDWEDVTGATGYTVSVNMIADKHADLTRKYVETSDSQIALSAIGIDPVSTTQQYEIQVRAVSGDTKKGSSAWSEKLVKRATFAEDELFPINNALYWTGVVDSVLETEFRDIRVKQYVADPTTESGNAVKMTMLGSRSAKSFFSLDLPQPLNLENGYSGIVLRLKVEDCNYESKETLGIQLVGARSDTGAEYRRALKIGEWIEYQLSMEEVAAYYQTGATQLSFAIVNSVPNKSLSTITVKVVLDSLKYQRFLPVPKNLRVEDGVFTWDTVDGTKGYTVIVNGNETFVETNEFDVSNLTGITQFKVRSETNIEGYKSSVYSETFYYEVLGENQIATFDHAGYASNTTYGHPTIKDVVNQTAFHGQPAIFNEANGTVSCTGWRTSYVGSGARIWTWTVNVENAIDLTRDGITIKFSFADYKDYDKGENYFTVINPSELDDSRKTLPIERGNLADGVACPYVQITSKGASYELSVSSAQLSALGYTSETKMISFALWNTVACEVSNYNGVLATLVLDDISYCEMLDAPTNVAINGATLSWTEVENATGYTVYANGVAVQENVTATTADLSELTVSAGIQVQANSTAENVKSSVHSAVVYFEVLGADQLATFDHAGYMNTVRVGNPNVTCVHGKTDCANRNAVSFGDGMITIGAYRDEYVGSDSSCQIVVVSVSLTKGLDLSRDGITIQFKIGSYGTKDNCFGLVNPRSNADGSYDISPKDRGEITANGVTATCPYVDVTLDKLHEWNVSSAQLTALGYQNGDTLLTFAVWNPTGQTHGSKFAASFSFDDISYYNE